MSQAFPEKILNYLKNYLGSSFQNGGCESSVPNSA